MEGRYSRDQLVQLFQSQRETNDIKERLSHLYMGSWEPHATNGASGASWGRKDDLGRDGQSGVDQCWDKDGSIQPMHTIELTEEDREVRIHRLRHLHMLTVDLDLYFFRELAPQTTDAER